MQEVMCYRGYTVSKGYDWYEVSYTVGIERVTKKCDSFYDAIRFIHDETGGDYFSNNFLDSYREAI